MKRLFSLLLSIVLILCLSAPTIFAADSSSTKTVRVGWFDSPYFLEDENGKKSGYAYDYLQKISSYTGWEYEYVEGGWYDLYQMLLDGEIDILADVTWSDEHLDYMLFSSDIMGSEDLYIYTAEVNTEISANDLSTINGKTIAIVDEPGEISMLDTWLSDNEISANIKIVTDDDEKIAEDLIAGKYDAVANVTFFDTYSKEISPIVKIDSDTIYFAINKNRYDIKSQIDEAMFIIQNNNRTYRNDLYTKYFGDAGNVQYLSLEEEEWISNNGTIKIGYRENYFPFCDTDKDGNPTGFLKDYIDNIKEQSAYKNLTFELIPFESITAAMDALRSGEIDSIFPITQTAYDTEAQGLSITDEIVSSNMYVITRNINRDIDLNTKLKVAVNKGNNDYEETINTFYPNWEIVYFDSTEDCLIGIKNNKADCLLISNFRLSSFEDLLSKYQLSALPTSKSFNICFATLKENSTVYSILDKLANEISDEDASAIITAKTLENKKTTVWDFVEDNLGLTIIFVLLTALIITFAAFQIGFNAKTEKMNIELAKKNKELLEANEKAEKLSKAKTEFLFNMSHDIRTPMNAILGFNNMAVRDIDDKEKALKHLNKAQVSGHALLSVINDILDTSRLDTGKIKATYVRVNMENCFNESKVVLKGLAKNKNIKLSFTVDEMEHKYVNADVTHLDRIFINIISNAIKYTPEGGSVTVTAKEIPAVKDGYARFLYTVTDTGIGISKEFQKKMFEPFTREENTTTSGVVGTGLGLSLVKSFVDLLGGKITCDSELGKGTTMSVEIECKLQEGESQDTEVNTPDVENLTLKGKNILLVEDNELNREIALDILCESEADVITAENGKDALDKIEQYGIDHFNVILMDIQMPIMDGYEATGEIRKLYPDNHIPIIAVSANAFDQDKQKSLDFGMDAHIAKPIKISELLSTIHDLI